MGESERRYQELIRTSPAPINLFDASGEIIWGNDAVLDLLGLDTREELVGRSIFEFIHPDDRYTAESELEAVVTEKKSIGPTPMRLTRADGEERIIRVSTAPGEYGGKDIGQAVVIDVTELNRVHDELAEAREFIEMALDTIEDVFYVIDTHGDLQRWNDALLDVSGYTETELRAMDIEDFFIDGHTELVSESIARAFATGRDTIEAVVRTKSGERIPYEFRKRRLVTDGSAIALVGIGRDITQRKSREQHLRTVDYTLQHHLRNQLNIIQGTVELLVEGDGTADGRHVAAIHESADKMLSLFDHHRDIVTHLLLDTTRERIDVIDVLETLFADFNAEYPHAELTVRGPDSAPVIAVPYITRAFHELLWNALKHNDADVPRVEVTVDADSSPVRITVADNGPVIFRQEYEFMHSPETLDSTSHPTGLGLWSVNLAVQYSRGTFTVDEDADDGNTIVVELPAPVDDWRDT
jgi:PAS domain S-box-containing protein